MLSFAADQLIVLGMDTNNESIFICHVIPMEFVTSVERFDKGMVRVVSAHVAFTVGWACVYMNEELIMNYY